MNRFLLSAAAALMVLTATGCNCTSCQNPDVVRETYTHKYGVTVSKNDWNSRGANGKVTTTYRDGITICRTFEKGQLHGLTTYTYPHSSVVQKTENYSNGNLVSKINHFPSGLHRKETAFIEPNHIKKTYWYEDGTPQRQEEVIDSKIVLGEYFTPAHELESRIQDGEGTRALRDPFGHLLSHDKIANGALLEQTTYFPEGDIESMTTFKDGLPEGERKTFAPGGEPKTVEQWWNGQQHGTTIVFQNGIKRSESNYLHGKKQGIEKLFDDLGQVAQEVTWVDGHRHGPTRLYVDGTVKTDWYYRDNMVSKLQYENPHHVR
ncbi:MAG: toxin-antitoxin system YwqK family antitoxin [Parachlamydiales bacterium]|nr:toxin-antitoxin system YwqK family antitoxin [Parachlamydiales bacterium]